MRNISKKTIINIIQYNSIDEWKGIATDSRKNLLSDKIQQQRWVPEYKVFPSIFLKNKIEN